MDSAIAALFREVVCAVRRLAVVGVDNRCRWSLHVNLCGNCLRTDHRSNIAFSHQHHDSRHCPRTARTANAGQKPFTLAADTSLIVMGRIKDYHEEDYRGCS